MVMGKSELSRSILERATYGVNANGEIVGGRKKETFFGKIKESAKRVGHLMDLSWCIIVNEANIDDMTIRAFKSDGDSLGVSVPISGYQVKRNRGAGEVLGIAYKAKKEGVSRVVINVPQRRAAEMYHQIVIQ